MSSTQMLFNKEKINRLFPFYILINKNLIIDSYGTSLEKLYKDCRKKPFSERFQIQQKGIELLDFSSFKSVCDQSITLLVNNQNKTILKGQFEFLEDTNSLLFIGSPLLNTMETIKENDLTLDDFAHHYPFAELLHVLKSQELVDDHLKQVAEQKKLEFQLIEARIQAEQSTRIKEIFLANMSHEIRTPMNAIIGMSNQLAKGTLTSQQQFYLEVIQSASENLLVIINDILDLSKIEAGKLSLENIGFEPKLLGIKAMRVLAYKAEERGLQLTSAFFDKNISPILIGDPYRLNQVLLNLMSNAIKFTEKGRVDLSFNLIEDDNSSQTIKVIVKDTGIGMDESFMEHLFEKFTQEYESTSRNYGGTGLGMSICKHLIDLMGGTMTVESKKGKGSTIAFIINLKKGVYADLPAKIVVKIDSDFLLGKKILIADDNEMNRLVASIFLENYGAEIIHAVNGRQVIDKFNLCKPDVILMDIQMPNMNGFEATRIIRNSRSNIPIIALTANAIKGESEKCIAGGMNDYVSKPFKEEELLKTIAKCLGKEVNLSKAEEVTAALSEELLYDLSALKEIGRGNDGFVEKMVSMFCDQTPPMINEMKSAYNAGDLEKMGAIAHKIKPSLDNLNIITLKHVIRNIESAGYHKEENEDLKELLEETDKVMSKVIENMKREYSIK